MSDLDLFACARADFVYAQLQLATTYCFIAERSGLALLPNYLKNVRRTYENVIRFMLRADLRVQELRDITFDAVQVKFRLEALEAQCRGNENREAVVVSEDVEKKPPTFPVVCIGGSAGSLSAIIDILSQLPAMAEMAIVIVSHRAPGGSGQLVRLLGKAAAIKVIEATDGMLLEPNRVFVAPPHRGITTDGVILKLAVGLTKKRGWPTLISEFLFSLAAMCGDRAIAIIVSGMGYDGSSALVAIKDGGGSTFVQSDAYYPDMPQAAMATNSVDLALSASEIGACLAFVCAASRPKASAR